MSNFFSKEAKFEAPMYVLNTAVFCFVSILYAIVFQNSGGIINIHNLYIRGESPYHVIGIVVIYVVMALIIKLLIRNKKIGIMKNSLDNIIRNTPQLIFSLGSSLSGILLATSILIPFDYGFGKLFYKYVAVTLIYFFAFIFFGLLTKFILDNLKT